MTDVEARCVWRQIHDGRFPTVEEERAAGLCANKLECGGHCCRPTGHDGACECIGDDPGMPGTCPA